MIYEYINNIIKYIYKFLLYGKTGVGINTKQSDCLIQIIKITLDRMSLEYQDKPHLKKQKQIIRVCQKLCYKILYKKYYIKPCTITDIDKYHNLKKRDIKLLYHIMAIHHDYLGLDIQNDTQYN